MAVPAAPPPRKLYFSVCIFSMKGFSSKFVVPAPLHTLPEQLSVLWLLASPGISGLIQKTGALRSTSDELASEKASSF